MYLNTMKWRSWDFPHKEHNEMHTMNTHYYRLLNFLWQTSFDANVYLCMTFSLIYSQIYFNKCVTMTFISKFQGCTICELLLIVEPTHVKASLFYYQIIGKWSDLLKPHIYICSMRELTFQSNARPIDFDVVLKQLATPLVFEVL